MTFYLCDRRLCRKCYEECRHTTSPAHAVNGKCDEPWDHRDRFEQIQTKRGDQWWEVDNADR